MRVCGAAARHGCRMKSVDREACGWKRHMGRWSVQHALGAGIVPPAPQLRFTRSLLQSRLGFRIMDAGILGFPPPRSAFKCGAERLRRVPSRRQRWGLSARTCVVGKVCSGAAAYSSLLSGYHMRNVLHRYAWNRPYASVARPEPKTINLTTHLVHPNRDDFHDGAVSSSSSLPFHARA